MAWFRRRIALFAERCFRNTRHQPDSTNAIPAEGSTMSERDNKPHDPNVTADVPSAAADSAGAPDALRTTDHVQGSVSTDGSHPLADAPADDLPAVPNYRVLREIARGGMGRVLAAYDLALDRDVALKVLLAGANSDRFVRESKITARLPHPGIPPVHALGTLADGSPFLAMKLIAGRTLADEMKTADRPRLLQAFVQVCQAVGFAHSRGIIHRDLKPSNVMVGAFGEVQVMDWGLAKDIDQASRERQRPEEAPPGTHGGTDPNQTTDQAAGESTDERTQAGTVLGTPAYMAPEQARGEAADPRSDVFALGGILCAILTGQPPYSGKSALEVIRRAAAADLTEANARLERCGADAELVGLCRRCLSPRPDDRPADGQAVAVEMTAYLDGVQERLRRAELAQAEARAKAAEEAKRRRLTLALAAAVVALLLGGGAFAWWRNAQAQAGRERDARNAEAVDALLNQAEEALERGDAARAKVALGAARKRSDEGGAEKEAERLGRLVADLALLGDLDAVDQFRWTWSENQFPDPAAVAMKTREALARFGIDPEAVSEDETAERVSASAVRQRIVSALDRLLLPFRLVDKVTPPAERQKVFTQLRADLAALLPKRAGVRALLRRVDADPYRDAVRDAVLAEDRAKFTALVGQQAALEQPAGFVASLGEMGAIPVERRRQLLAAAVSRRPGDLGLLITLGNSYTIDQKESAGAGLRWYQAAVAAAPANAAAHHNLGVALATKGELDEAIACYRKAIASDPQHAMAHSNLGVALHRKGEADEAIACFRKAIESDPKLALAHINLGNALRVRGQVEEAIACYRKAIESDPKNAVAHSNLGAVLCDFKRDYGEAIVCFRKAIALGPKNAPAHYNLGNALQHKGEVDEAIASFRKAIEIDPKHANAHTNLGNALRDRGQVDEAIASFRKAIEIGPKNAKAHTNLGNALNARGQVDEAIACYRQAIAFDPKLTKVHYNLGNALRDKGQVDEAIACYRKAIESDPKYAMAHTNLGNALAVKGQVDEAIASFRKAIESDPKLAYAHGALGQALLGKGRFAPARDATARALELLPANQPLRAVVSRQLQVCTRLLQLEGRLPGLLRGEDRPASADEGLEIARMCRLKRMHAAAARFSALAFAADPKAAGNPALPQRYDAACSAALAAAGQGKDEGKLDDKERARLRKQALDWLRADLALRTRQLDSGRPADRAEVQRVMKHWQGDTDLTGIRDMAALEKLPPDEQKAFTQLWVDVAALQKRAEEMPK
jgi:tetratricopeptide (TPR) repeat protein